MRHRPWPIVLFALCQILLEPITNILLGAYLSRVTPAAYLSYFAARHDYLSLVYTSLLPMIMGVAVFAMKGWSLPVFLAGATWGLIGNIQTHLQNPQAFPLHFFLPFFFINVAFASYFLLPQVRVAYLNSKVRLWEALPRYQVELKGKLIRNHTSESVRIKDISLEGVFITPPHTKLELGDELRLKFQFLNQVVSVSSRVMHQRGETGYGLKFGEMSKGTKYQIKLIVGTCHKFHFQGRPDKYLTPVGFARWIKRAVHNPRALLPEIQEQLEPDQDITDKNAA